MTWISILHSFHALPKALSGISVLCQSFDYQRSIFHPLSISWARPERSLAIYYLLDNLALWNISYYPRSQEDDIDISIKPFFAYLKEKNCKTHLKKHFWYIFYLGEKMTERLCTEDTYHDDCHGKQINKVINTHDHGISYLVNNVNEKLHHHYNFWQVCKVWFIW